MLRRFVIGRLTAGQQGLKTSATQKMRIVPVPVRSDNYAYLLIDEATNEAAAVDPFDVDKIAEKAKEEGVKFTTLITTHHHNDHSGGNLEFVRRFPGVEVYGGSSTIPALTKVVKDGESFGIGKDTQVKCMATPCHTQDSICYYVTDRNHSDQKGVFTGDTLFVGGCGRFFEGSPEEMHASLSYLGTLPDDTITYVGHEYTKDNLKFGASVDPSNDAIQAHVKFSDANSVTTGKSTIGDEKKFNVFMRLDSEAIQKATGETETATVMAKLRSMKNEFRG